MKRHRKVQRVNLRAKQTRVLAERALNEDKK